MFIAKKNFLHTFLENAYPWITWIFLGFNLYAILGGAFVRATGSGAGCGAHWPLCNGDIIPDFSMLHTAIEFVHRISSGIIGIGSVILLILTFKLNKNKYLKTAASVAFTFVIIEALIGAWLVLYGLVAENSSMQRAVIMSIHLVSTFILIAALLFTAAWSSGFSLPKFSGQGKKLLLLGSALFLLVLVGMSGAITALGDTLFMPHAVGEGLLSSFSNSDHFLKSLRAYHPIIATLSAIYIVTLAWNLTPSGSQPRQFKLCLFVTFVFTIQIACGFLNIYLRAPVAMQIIHLFIGDLSWIITLLFANECLSTNTASTNANRRVF